MPPLGELGGLLQRHRRNFRGRHLATLLRQPHRVATFAIGHAKKQYLVESAGETAFGLMQAIKQVFDPKGILNPGKVCTNVEEG